MVIVFVVRSPAFGDGQEMAQKYGKKIDNVSPPLEWEGAPDEARSFALACVDIHPVARGYVHWLIAGISPQLSSLPEGAAGTSNPGFTEIKPYVGPFPPSGTHDYEFTLYALTDRHSRPKAWSDIAGVPPGRGAKLSGHGDTDRKVHQDQVRSGCQRPSQRSGTPRLSGELGEDLDIASPRLGHHIRGNGRAGVGTIPVAQRR